MVRPYVFFFIVCLEIMLRFEAHSQIICEVELVLSSDDQKYDYFLNSPEQGGPVLRAVISQWNPSPLSIDLLSLHKLKYIRFTDPSKGN